MIVGVDLGTRRVALSCIDEDFVWSLDMDKVALRRIYSSEWQMGTALAESSYLAMRNAGIAPSKMYFERPVVFKNVNTSVGQALSAGAFFSHLPGQAVQIYPSSVWKKEVIGSGNANKADTRSWVEREHPTLAQACAGVEDCYDAVAICEYGRRVASLG